MHGLTQDEIKKLKQIRALATHDLPAAKKKASAWILANKQRRVVRIAATNSVKGLRR